VTSRPAEEVVLVSSAEFALKSSPVRRTLEQRLVDDLRFVLRNANIQCSSIDRVAGRIIIRGIDNAQKAAQAITKVFGVAHAIPAITVAGSMDSILSAIQLVATETFTYGQSFAVRCHGSATTTFSSRSVEREAGSQILKALADRKIRVNLDHPDVTISVALAGEIAYLYTTRYDGPGGLPLSSQWKMLGLLDSFLSLFAAYVMMRRGCLTQLLIPCSDTETRFQTDRQIQLARKLRQFVTREKYPAFILEVDKMPQSIGLLRHLALEFAKERRFRGVIFADVRGSIAFDTSISKRSRELGLPIFYPLIGLEETDLSNLGNSIGLEWRSSDDGPLQCTHANEFNLPVTHITEISL